MPQTPDELAQKKALRKAEKEAKKGNSPASATTPAPTRAAAIAEARRRSSTTSPAVERSLMDPYDNPSASGSGAGTLPNAPTNHPGADTAMPSPPPSSPVAPSQPASTHPGGATAPVFGNVAVASGANPTPFSMNNFEGGFDFNTPVPPFEGQVPADPNDAPPPFTFAAQGAKVLKTAADFNGWGVSRMQDQLAYDANYIDLTEVQLQTAERDLDCQEELAQSLQQDLNEEKARNESLQQNRDSALALSVSIQLDLNAANAQNELLRDDLVKEKALNNSLRQTLEDQKNTCHNTIAEKEKVIKDQAATVKQLENVNATQRKELENNAKRIRVLDDNRKEDEESVKKAENDLGIKTRELWTCESNGRDKQKRIEELLAQISLLESNFAKAESVMEDLQDKLNKSLAERDDLEEENDALRDEEQLAKERSEDLNNAMEEEQAQLLVIDEENKAEKHRLRRQLQAKEEENQTLRGQLNMKEQETEAVREQLARVLQDQKLREVWVEPRVSRLQSSHSTSSSSSAKSFTSSAESPIQPGDPPNSSSPASPHLSAVLEDVEEQYPPLPSSPTASADDLPPLPSSPAGSATAEDNKPNSTPRPAFSQGSEPSSPSSSDSSSDLYAEPHDEGWIRISDLRGIIEGSPRVGLSRSKVLVVERELQRAWIIRPSQGIALRDHVPTTTIGTQTEPEIKETKIWKTTRDSGTQMDEDIVSIADIAAIAQGHEPHALTPVIVRAMIENILENFAKRYAQSTDYMRVTDIERVANAQEPTDSVAPPASWNVVKRLFEMFRERTIREQSPQQPLAFFGPRTVASTAPLAAPLGFYSPRTVASTSPLSPSRHATLDANSQTHGRPLNFSVVRTNASTTPQVAPLGFYSPRTVASTAPVSPSKPLTSDTSTQTPNQPLNFSPITTVSTAPILPLKATHRSAQTQTTRPKTGNAGTQTTRAATQDGWAQTFSQRLRWAPISSISTAPIAPSPSTPPQPLGRSRVFTTFQLGPVDPTPVLAPGPRYPPSPPAQVITIFPARNPVFRTDFFGFGPELEIERSWLLLLLMVFLGVMLTSSIVVDGMRGQWLEANEVTRLSVLRWRHWTDQGGWPGLLREVLGGGVGSEWRWALERGIDFSGGVLG